MARRSVEPPEDDLDDTLDDDELEPEAEDGDSDSDDSDGERPAEVEKFWEKVRVSPVEIALPRGVGYTLRAYRMSDTLGTEDDESDEERAADDDRDQDDEESSSKADELDEDEEDESEDDKDESDDESEDDEEDEEDESDEDEEEEEPEPEEIPVFLTQDRRLLMFRSPEGLVTFVRSGEATDLDIVDEWETLRTDLSVDQVVVDEDDRYELDLVVENLRGGQDAWDAGLLVKAGEVARDLGYALRIESVMTALSPGSPLDKLDEALRDAESGRIGAFFARRKLRRIGAQQAALAWRSIIGKISTSVDWRD